jgi:cysteine desulfurase
MLPFFTDQYGNPHSRTHAYGWEAESAVDEARKVCSLSLFLSLPSSSLASNGNVSLTNRLSALLSVQNVADLIGADAKDIIFTSGATESNNLIVKGIAKFNGERKKHIITTQTVRSSPPFLHPLLSLNR